MAKKPKKKKPTPVESIQHGDKRVNIPTEELRGFVGDEERAPGKLLYPRDPSLDPQLVWAGKDAQDRADLAVPVVPVYIQEKVHPRALVEELRRTAEEGEEEPEVRLFADFNGIPFEEMVDFYHHEQNWANRMVLGDSLLVMTSLAEKEGLRGRVQMIYVDPPYGIKFASNWQVSTRRRDVKDGKAEDATRQPEQVKAFRDTWELGIHSYLAYLRDRFVAARELLTESGSIFVQIGDENVHLVRCVLDEVFGSENFISEIAFATSTGRTAKYLDCVSDTLLWYAKDLDNMKFRGLFIEKPIEKDYPYEDENGAFELADLSSQHESPTRSVPFDYRNNTYEPPKGRQWSTDPVHGLRRIDIAGRIYEFSENQIRFKKYASDYGVSKINNVWTDTQFGAFQRQKIYAVQTNTKVAERCLLMATDPGDLVLDPTCGSGTTAYVAEQWGRRWITVDTSRVALALARTRLMAARYPYYLLADSRAGREKEAEITGVPPDASAPAPGGDVKKGFVYKRVPHVTLKAIANNDEIDVIHERYREKLEPLCAELNNQLGEKWEEWEVPREAGEAWAGNTRELHRRWWELRRERQREIDASIARAAETETLYDQPYEDNKTVRVSGPFTVESLSPHRVVAAEEELPAGEREGRAEAAQFATMIIDNLRAAGVQNTIKNERLKFDRLESFAGVYLQAAGEYAENGSSRRVAVCIGPEHGTVGPQLVREAAKEAVQGVGFDLLVVCGFAFDPHVAEEAKRYGKLVVLPARMNPDLAMGDELLKKTGSGNLFMVFGEPDVELTSEHDGRLVVTVKGLDVYDPTTGEIRSSSTDDVACWFVDTNYNGESFFVRHAYFTGADRPYDKLKRTLRGDVNEAAWASLYRTKSRPFDPPATGKIAVKVINHYGDEVLKVFEVGEVQGKE
jgi:adenine-specific DNA-methyltransferase